MERPDRGDPAIAFVGLGGLFSEAFCNGPDHLVKVVEDAADLT
jgi:hypothetical protein